MQFKPGMIVKSDAGHDGGSYYVIVKAKENRFYIADGKRRKLNKPKCKNPKHLRHTNKAVDLMQTDTNQKLRRVLTDLNSGTMSVK